MHLLRRGMHPITLTVRSEEKCHHQLGGCNIWIFWSVAIFGLIVNITCSYTRSLDRGQYSRLLDLIDESNVPPWKPPPGLLFCLKFMICLPRQDYRSNTVDRLFSVWFMTSSIWFNFIQWQTNLIRLALPCSPTHFSPKTCHMSTWAMRCEASALEPAVLSFTPIRSNVKLKVSGLWDDSANDWLIW